MAGPRDDDERSGFGVRRGWRAPKGTAGPGRRSAKGRGAAPGGTGPRAAGAAGSDATAAGTPASEDGPPDGTAGSIAAASLARLAGLPPSDAPALDAAGLPASGAPDLLPRGLRALGALVRESREAAETAERRAEQTTAHRTRDAATARRRLDRAGEREARQATKAAAEQGERQRLSGELERERTRLAQVVAERDHLRERAEAGRPGGRTDRGAGPSDPAGSGRVPADQDDLAGPPAGRDDAELAGLRARVADLERRLEDRGRALEQLTDLREADAAEREHLRGAARRLRRLALEAGSADVDLVDPDDHRPLRVDDLPEVRTVLAAVELAAAHAQHLVFSERAFSSARTAPYDEPRKLLRDLVALDRVAAAWAVAGGIGRPIRDVALAQQLDWADDVSTTARHQNPREYRFTHDGRPLWAGPHVRVATGRGLQRTCRIYLALVKGGEPDLAGLPRGIYVGPVGRHLSDSTSG